VIALTHRATGHQIKVDDESADFWKAAGYREDQAEKKAPAKKATSSKSKK
jgi:hypothetical protein